MLLQRGMGVSSYNVVAESFFIIIYLITIIIFFLRLVMISNAATCPLYALPVQLPIHQYEDELLSILEGQVDPISNSFVEQGGTQSLDSPSRIGF